MVISCLAGSGISRGRNLVNKSPGFFLTGCARRACLGALCLSALVLVEAVLVRVFRGCPLAQLSNGRGWIRFEEAKTGDLPRWLIGEA